MTSPLMAARLAMEKEVGRYHKTPKLHHHAWLVYDDFSENVMLVGTEAECDAWITEQGLRAALRTLGEGDLSEAVHEAAHARLEGADLSAQIKAALLALADGEG
jgi:hypothetical protein